MGDLPRDASATSGTLRAIVTARNREAEGIDSFELRSANGLELPAFSAGAHIDVHLPGGEVRQYSLCNDPFERDRYVIAVLRDPASRGGSVTMHDEVRVGMILPVSAPRCTFPLHRADHSILIAGGIGVTPLLSMAQQLRRDGASFELHYCIRSKAVAAFADMLAGAEATRLYFDDGAGAGRFAPRAALAKPRPDTRVYVCGPPGFIEYVLNAARVCGWAETQLHCEYFAAAPIDTSADASFIVRLARRGTALSVPHDRTVADVLRANGILLPMSCRQGVCGTCIVPVLSGICDHRDMFLTKTEQARNDQFTPCCSRALSDELVLDL